MRLAQNAPRGLEVRVLANDGPFLLEKLKPGGELREAVPAGSVRVQLVRSTSTQVFEVLEEERLELRAGAAVLVALGEG